jgi:hypothetical protein
MLVMRLIELGWMKHRSSVVEVHDAAKDSCLFMVRRCERCSRLVRFNHTVVQLISNLFGRQLQDLQRQFSNILELFYYLVSMKNKLVQLQARDGFLPPSS